MIAELIIQPNKKLVISSFERLDDGSGCAVLNVVSGRFTYLTNEFYFDGFSIFVDALESVHKTLSGGAELRFHHESECVRFEAKSLGHISFNGEFIEYGAIQQTLNVGFEFDQSYLLGFIEQLRAVEHAIYS